MHHPAAFLHPALDLAALELLCSSAESVFSPYAAIAAVYLYGSGAHREPLADLDIAVLTEHGADIAGLESLAATLQAEGAPHGPDIDMRPLRGTSPRFRTNVIREGRLIFERSRATRIAFEAEPMPNRCRIDDRVVRFQTDSGAHDGKDAQTVDSWVMPRLENSLGWPRLS